MPRNLAIYLFLPLFFLLVSCTNSGNTDEDLIEADSTSLEVNTLEGTELPALTPAQELSAETAAVLIDSETEISPPPPPPPPAKEDIESEVKEEPCCADITALQACCCEKLMGLLKDHLKADNLEAASNLSGKDDYYVPCKTQFTDFEAQFNQLIEDYFNDSE